VFEGPFATEQALPGRAAAGLHCCPPAADCLGWEAAAAREREQSISLGERNKSFVSISQCKKGKHLGKHMACVWKKKKKNITLLRAVQTK